MVCQSGRNFCLCSRRDANACILHNTEDPSSAVDVAETGSRERRGGRATERERFLTSIMFRKSGSYSFGMFEEFICTILNACGLYT